MFENRASCRSVPPAANCSHLPMAAWTPWCSPASYNLNSSSLNFARASLGRLSAWYFLATKSTCSQSPHLPSTSSMACLYNYRRRTSMARDSSLTSPRMAQLSLRCHSLSVRTSSTAESTSKAATHLAQATKHPVLRADDDLVNADVLPISQPDRQVGVLRVVGGLGGTHDGWWMQGMRE